MKTKVRKSSRGKHKKVVKDNPETPENEIVEEDPNDPVDPCLCYHCGISKSVTLVPLRVSGKGIVGFIYLCPVDTVLNQRGELTLERIGANEQDQG